MSEKISKIFLVIVEALVSLASVKTLIDLYIDNDQIINFIIVIYILAAVAAYAYRGKEDSK